MRENISEWVVDSAYQNWHATLPPFRRNPQGCAPLITLSRRGFCLSPQEIVLRTIHDVLTLTASGNLYSSPSIAPRRRISVEVSMRIARLVAFLTVFFAMAAVLASAAACPLNSPSGQVRHVIYVQFDNTHFVRHNPNVPSDLPRIPHLLP